MDHQTAKTPEDQMRTCLSMGAAAPALLLAALCVCVLTPPLLAEDRLVPLDGRAYGSEVTGIDDQGAVAVKGGKAPVPLQGLIRIDRKIKAQPDKKSGIVVHLIDGTEIRARSVAGADSVCSVEWAYGKGWKLPFSSIHAIHFKGQWAAKGPIKSVERFEKVVSGDEEPADKDRLFVVSSDELQSLAGGLQDLAKEKITFVWEGEARKVSRTKLYGVAFARTEETPDPVGRCRVHLADGSTVWGKVTGLKAGRLALKIVGDKALEIPWKAAVRLEIKSDRLTFLSDLKPLKVVQEAQMTFVGPWRRDLSVLGNPLKLGDRTFEKGLGVHARCLLTYPRDQRFDVFAATIGIDAETEGKGDCIFKVLGDGKELFQKRVKGADKPVPVRIDVADIDRLTLAVEPGEDFDLADHGNWCDARLLAKKDEGK